jgi:hypothetical protein
MKQYGVATGLGASFAWLTPDGSQPDMAAAQQRRELQKVKRESCAAEETFKRG